MFLASLARRATVYTLVLLALFFAVAAPSPTRAQTTTGTTVTGRILDASIGLPIPGASVELRAQGRSVATGTTTSDGTFSIANVPAGTYTLVIAAHGYQTVASVPLPIEAGQPLVEFQTAILPASAGLRTIGEVKSVSRSTLQTSATINTYLSPSIIQDQNYVRAGDAIGTLPAVTASTSSSQGDDLSISIRGFDSSETATLLDGHPIGPIGAFGHGFDYQLAQFWGLSDIGVIYGSGATGLYGVPTIAGAVNFETLNPTNAPHAAFTDGFGDNGKALSAGSVTGTLGRLGYAIAYGVQGTDGELGPAPIKQSALLGGGADQCSASSVSQGIATLIPGDVAACTYPVTGAYTNRNAIAKFTYQLDRKTSVLATAYNLAMFADSTGNGDTDYLTPEFVALSHPSGVNDTQTLPNGASATCTNSYVVATSVSNYECLSSSQFASTFSGPTGGGNFGRMHAATLQDYHARVTRQVGAGQLIVDGYTDRYHYLNFKGIGSRYYDDTYFTHGALVSDEYAGKRHDFSFGVYFQHQLHETNSGTFQGPFVGYTLADTNYFIHDAYSATDRLTVYADLGFDRSQNTATTSFDPRLALQYRPTANDVFRVAGGRSTSEPDPSLLFGGFSYGSVNSFNPFSNCGSLAPIGSGSSPDVKPEQARDLELSAAHRFANQATFEADLYDTVETNPILSGTFPLSVIPPNELPSAADVNAFVSKLQGVCGGITGQTYSAANLGVSTSFNAGQATYRGVTLQGSLPLVRGLAINGGYTVQSAFYSGIGNDILANNQYLLNNHQLLAVPMHQATLGLGYTNQQGALSARIDAYYVGANNPLYRPSYWYANANISKSVGPVTFNLGASNVFNSIASAYGLVGYGTYKPENQFGDGLTTGLSQGSEQFGLAGRQLFFTTTFRF